MTPSRTLAALLAGGVSLACIPAIFAQTTGMTDPVGFITIKVPGKGSATSPALSFPGLSLTQRVEYEGAAEAVGSNSLTDTDASWVDNQFNGAAGSYYLELTSGPAAGTTYDITATSASGRTITTAQALEAGAAAGVRFKIRRNWTISGVFGSTSPLSSGLQAGYSTTADQVLVYDGANYETYFYSSGGFAGTGWRKAGSGSADQARKKFDPDKGPLIQRQGISDVSFKLIGAVKTGPSVSRIVTGLNFVFNAYASPMTLASSGLYSGDPTTGLAGGNSSSADQVLIYDGANYDTYFYSSGGLLGAGWRRAGSGSADKANTPLPVGKGFIIKRQNATPFLWRAPQHPAAL